jgi:hypothetical protein
MICRIFSALFILMLAVLPAHAQDMTIEQAYEAIPHARTPFNAKQSDISAADAKYLQHFFFASDLATRARVQALQQFYHREDIGALKEYDGEINKLLASFDLVKTPANLQAAQENLLGAIRDQQKFFHEWAALKGTPAFAAMKQNIGQNASVQSAHQKLFTAYSQLKELYPQETAHNQQAFFDHLCALDFI